MSWLIVVGWAAIWLGFGLVFRSKRFHRVVASASSVMIAILAIAAINLPSAI